MHGWSKLTLIAALLAYVPSLNAQQVRAGIKVGGQITDALSAAPAVVPPSPDFNHFTWGPVAEVILTHGLGFEFGAFHKHYAYSFLIIGPLHNPIGIVDTHIGYWDLPLLVKWQTGKHPLAPFVAGGLAHRHTNGTGLRPMPNPELIQNPDRNPVRDILLNRWTRGAVVGGGVTYAAGPFRLTPEIRYTHWTKPALEVPILLVTGPANAWQTNRNQLDVLLGLTVGKR